jgi:DNA-directed RNA polymerase specialized sigma24 family protein
MSTDNFYRKAAKQYREAPLTYDEVDELALKARDGDRAAYDKLVIELASLAYTALADRNVRELGEWRGLTKDDMRQAAMVMMIEGLAVWRPKAASFRTIAYQRAHWGVLNAINGAHYVKVPRNLAGIVASGREDEFKQDYRPETLRKARNAVRPPISLLSSGLGDREERSDGRQRQVYDSALGHEDEGYRHAEEALTIEQLLERVELDPWKERCLLSWSGLPDRELGRVLRPKEVADMARVTPQAVWEAAKRGRAKLKKYREKRTARRSA